jgi:integrase
LLQVFHHGGELTLEGTIRERIERDRDAVATVRERFAAREERLNERLDGLRRDLERADHGDLISLGQKATERVLYMTAAMTGLRQGELLGLRWRDINWDAGRVRVRQNFVRGAFGTPKSSARRARSRSRRKSRMGSRSTGTARRTRNPTTWSFAIPSPGQPLDRSRLLKRLKAAAKRARIR